ncbi:MAG: class II fumarate hydratase [Candidatus Thorarchaeota archaeon]|nr:class II fumarate hydratase [Candidatus Thorarchaeota archaeon]
MRKERDALGEVEVPAEAYWGVNTQRAIRSFRISGSTLPEEFILALAMVKKACLLANASSGAIDKQLADAVLKAVDEILVERKHLDQFPVDVYQAGSGTQTNMNMNEVLANRANEILGHPRGQKAPVHPNDHVNMGQSSNDVIPTAMHLAVLEMLNTDLFPALERLMQVLDSKVKEFRGVVKIGRTHLQDAVPIPLSTEFSVYRSQVMSSLSQLQEDREDLSVVPIGGTAVGTGINAREGFAADVVYHLSKLTRMPIRSSPVKAEGIASHAAIVRLSASLRTLALACMKMANDIRWMASGPRAGLGELILPANEPGSSIMPGKVNPTQSESLIQVCLRVIGNDETIALAEGFGSVLDLNVTKPLMASVILESIRLMSSGIESFVTHCLEGIRPNTDRISRQLQEGLMVVTRLAPLIGYDRAAEVARAAQESGRSIKQTVMEMGIMIDQDLDELLDPSKMV